MKILLVEDDEETAAAVVESDLAQLEEEIDQHDWISARGG